ncbi:hypothetical protein CDL15_Pgr003714 [Punica granatum]|uniref:Uncharacterized protein n=1 Tax=Punica granatum TaxID=22663 RepID=A0A218XVJ5_PUNGR|nr:hypothetical protein CDL15_Pgr003714 [Punica granatum]
MDQLIIKASKFLPAQHKRSRTRVVPQMQIAKVTLAELGFQCVWMGIAVVATRSAQCFQLYSAVRLKNAKDSSLAEPGFRCVSWENVLAFRPRAHYNVMLLY